MSALHLACYSTVASLKLPSWRAALGSEPNGSGGLRVVCPVAFPERCLTLKISFAVKSYIESIDYYAFI